MLYSRLVRMNEVSDQLIGQKTRSENKNQVAVDLGFRSEASTKAIDFRQTIY